MSKKNTDTNEPMSYKKFKIALRKIKGAAIIRLGLGKDDTFADGVYKDDWQDNYLTPRENEIGLDRPYDLALIIGENYGLQVTPTFHEQMNKMGYTSLDLRDIVMKMKRYGDKLGNDTYEIISNPKLKG